MFHLGCLGLDTLLKVLVFRILDLRGFSQSPTPTPFQMVLGRGKESVGPLSVHVRGLFLEIRLVLREEASQLDRTRGKSTVVLSLEVLQPSSGVSGSPGLSPLFS